MTKWWKTVSTGWYHSFRSTACQKKKIYSNLNIGTWTVYKGPDWILYLKRDALMRKGLWLLPHRKISSLNKKIHATVKNKWRTVLNLHELVRTLMWSMEGEGGRTYRGCRSGGGARARSVLMRLMQRPMVMQRRGSMAAAGLESNASQGRQWRRRGWGGKVKMTPGPIYKANG